jgi:hypothetical protein
VYHSGWGNDGKGRGNQFYIRIPNRGMVEFLSHSNREETNMVVLGTDHYDLMNTTYSKLKKGMLLEANKWEYRSIDRKTADRIRGTWMVDEVMDVDGKEVEFDASTGALHAPVYNVTVKDVPELSELDELLKQLGGDLSSAVAKQKTTLTWSEVESGKYDGATVNVGLSEGRRWDGILTNELGGYVVAGRGYNITVPILLLAPASVRDNDSTTSTVQQEGECMNCEEDVVNDCKCGVRPTLGEYEDGIVEVLPHGTRLDDEGDCHDCGDGNDLCSGCRECLSCGWHFSKCGRIE